jgi:hypothetical protein
LDIDTEVITMTLQGIARMLSVIPTEELEAHVKACRESLYNHTAFAPVLDPGAYLDNLRSGRIDSAKIQLELVEGFLQARRAMDKLLNAETKK